MSARKKTPAKPHRDVQVAQVVGRTDVILTMIPWLGGVFLVLASAVPLWFVQPMIEDMAGKKTNISVTFSLSIVVNLLFTGTFFLQRNKIAKQRDELIRLRARLDTIDNERIQEAGAKGSRR